MSTAAITYRHNFPSLLGRSVVDEIFGAFLNDMPTAVRQSTSGYPVADIFRNEDGSTSIQFALAGFAKKEINVEVKPEKRSITISGEAAETIDGAPTRRIAKRAFTIYREVTLLNGTSHSPLTAISIAPSYKIS